MSRDEIEKLKALERKATPPPWTSALTGRRDNKVLVMAGDEPLLGDGDDGDCFISTRDLPFLAEARNALPRLLEERERLLEALRRVRDRAAIGQMAAQQGMVFSFDQAVADAIRFAEAPASKEGT